jgi:catechol 2,3-dioxygenase-like lactoylglutathione lyase family enzyme
MTITLNHTIVPARDKRAAAQFFARIFGLHADPNGGHFAPVRINDTLTLLFDDVKEFESHHYAFHVSDAGVRFHLRLHSRGEARLWQRTVEPRQR